MNDIFFLIRLQGLLLYLRCNAVLDQKLGRRNRENKKYRLIVLFHDKIFSFPVCIVFATMLVAFRWCSVLWIATSWKDRFKLLWLVDTSCCMSWFLAKSCPLGHFHFTYITNIVSVKTQVKFLSMSLTIMISTVRHSMSAGCFVSSIYFPYIWQHSFSLRFYCMSTNLWQNFLQVAVTGSMFMEQLDLQA